MYDAILQVEEFSRNLWSARELRDWLLEKQSSE
jgi:hypothetical protein